MTDYTDPNHDRRAPVPQGWHLKKEVNLTIIISVIGIAVACVTAYSDVKKEIELIKADAQNTRLQIAKNDADSDIAFGQIRDMYVRLDSKMDRVIERIFK